MKKKMVAFKCIFVPTAFEIKLLKQKIQLTGVFWLLHCRSHQVPQEVIFYYEKRVAKRLLIKIGIRIL